MITLSADIQLVVYNEAIIKNASISHEDLTEIETMKISSSLSEVLNKKVSPRNPYILGVSKLSDVATYSEGKEDFLIGKQLSDENGNFEKPYVLHILQPPLFPDTALLAICFDDYNGYHPKSIVVKTEITMVDGGGNVETQTVEKEYIDDDAIFTIQQPFIDTAEVIMHHITIKDWSEAKRPLVVQGIYYFHEILADKNNILSLERNIVDRADFDNPSFGIISSTANLVFSDANGEIKDYADSGLLKKGLETKFYLNNTIYKQSQKIGYYYTNKWSYDADNREVSVQLKDSLEGLQSVSIPRLPLQEPMTKYALFAWIGGKISFGFPSTRFGKFVFEEKTLEYLNSTADEDMIPHPYLQEQSAWSALTKICEIAALHIYKNENGDIFVIRDFPKE